MHLTMIIFTTRIILLKLFLLHFYRLIIVSQIVLFREVSVKTTQHNASYLIGETSTTALKLVYRAISDPIIFTCDGASNRMKEGLK